MRKLLFTFCFLTIGLVASVMSQNNWIGINQDKPADAGITLVRSNISETQIHFTLEGFNESNVRTYRGAEVVISTPGGVGIIEKGMPDLGKVFADIIIPDTEKMEVQIVRSSYKEFHNVDVAPSKGHFTRDIDPEDVPYIYDEVYNQDAFWPGALARLEDPFIIRDFRGQTVTVYPFQYNPVTRVLRVYTDIVVEVKATGEEGENTLARTRDIGRMDREFRQVYNRMFLNMDYYETNKYILEEEGSMLIIAYDDFADAMQPLIDWKRTIGRNTTMVTKSEVGSTAAAIKTYVQDYYDNNDDFSYLLLIGDAPQIPTNNTSWGHSDNAYGFLVGNDQYNEIFVGRFSAETLAHVETQVQRMIEYERDLNETDTWLSNGMGVARNEGTGGGHFGENDYVHMNFIRDTLLNFTYDVVYQNYDNNVPGIPNTTAAVMSGHFNEGVSIVNFCNHGSTTGWSVASYSNTHVNALTNVGRLPFIWSVACVNGNFVNAFCFAEAWLRATHDGEPTGAIGTMMSTINQLWQPPMTGQDEMVTILAEKRDYINRTFGGLSFNGSMKMISSHGGGGIETHVTWTLFGDPTLLVRTATPQPINANYDPVILIGSSTSFDFTLDAPDGSRATLSYYDELEQEVVIIGTGIVEQGSVSVVFEEELNEPRGLTLAITGFNMQTYLNEDIQVIPPDGPYVVFDTYLLNDEDGNNNGQADYNEIITLDVSLKNVGIEEASGVQAVLSTESEYITILENQMTWGNIPEDGNLLVENAFVFEVAEIIPDNHVVLFNLAITADEGKEWSSNFTARIYSPLFTIDNYIVDDGEDGNNRLDPGETANVVVRYTNTGGAPAMAPVTEMFAANPYLTILNGTVEPGIILPGDYADVEFIVEAHPSAMEGTFVDLLFSIEDGHYFESEQLIIIGQQPEQVIGDGTEVSGQFPFYNYYKANRSHMLYLAEELGPGEKTITEIGFEILRASPAPFHLLPNFKLRMKHVEHSVVPNSFIATSDDDIVYQSNPHEMPLATGWHVFELDEAFEYNGEDNLLIEIVWGLLPNWTSSTSFFQVASTTQAENMVVFGYNDNNPVPNYNGVSKVRPNIWFAFEGEAGEDPQLVTFNVKNNYDEILENATVKIGSFIMHTDDQGEAALELIPGEFLFSAFAEGHRAIVNEAFIITPGEPLNIEIVLTKVFEVSFTITNNWGHEIIDAVISINDHEYEQGLCLIGDMEPGTHSYTVKAPHHYDYTGEFEISDSDIEMTVILNPDGTSVSETLEDAINIFPNPFTDYLNIRLPEGTTANLTLINILGETISFHKEVSGSHTMGVRHLPVGNYFLHIETPEGKVVRKISKMR